MRDHVGGDVAAGARLCSRSPPTGPTPPQAVADQPRGDVVEPPGGNGTTIRTASAASPQPMRAMKEWLARRRRWPQARQTDDPEQSGDHPWRSASMLNAVGLSGLRPPPSPPSHSFIARIGCGLAAEVVRIVVPFRRAARPTSPRGWSATACRRWGQSVVIENKPGAGATSPPTWSRIPTRRYTIFIVGPGLATNQFLIRR